MNGTEVEHYKTSLYPHSLQRQGTSFENTPLGVSVRYILGFITMFFVFKIKKKLLFSVHVEFLGHLHIFFMIFYIFSLFL